VKPKVKDGIFNKKNPEGGVLSLDFLFYRRRGDIHIEVMFKISINLAAFGLSLLQIFQRLKLWNKQKKEKNLTII
jgi:hypothetical protein